MKIEIKENEKTIIDKEKKIIDEEKEQNITNQEI